MVDGIASQRTSHCSIRRNERGFRSQSEPVQEGSGVGGAPSGGNRHGDPGLLGRPDRLGIAPAHLLGKGRQQGSIHVNRHQANRRMHRSSVPAKAAGGLRFLLLGPGLAHDLL